LNAAALKLSGYSRPPANRVMSAGLFFEGSAVDVPAIGDGDPTVISTLASAGPKASRIFSFTGVASCSVVRMLNRVSEESLAIRRLSTVTSGRTLAFDLTNSARFDSESDWT